MSSRMSADARIPVVIETDPAMPLGPGDCRLVLPAMSGLHEGAAVGCACCRPRGPVAQALAALFLRQVCGGGGAIRRVVASDGDAEAIRRTIAEDVLASARFRFAGSVGHQPLTGYGNAARHLDPSRHGPA